MCFRLFRDLEESSQEQDPGPRAHAPSGTVPVRHTLSEMPMCDDRLDRGSAARAVCVQHDTEVRLQPGRRDGLHNNEQACTKVDSGILVHWPLRDMTRSRKITIMCLFKMLINRRIYLLARQRSIIFLFTSLTRKCIDLGKMGIVLILIFLPKGLFLEANLKSSDKKVNFKGKIFMKCISNL